MIPMCRPLLPPAGELLPYLQRIDSNRYYSNAGPLVREYENRMSNLFDCYVAATNSGTAGLTAALIAQDVGGELFLPAWSFVATANAVKAAGLEPVLIDVDELTWTSADTDIVVAPFGAPVAYEGEVMTDAAAAFDAVALGQIKIGDAPIVISTHATKTFSTGEGGLVLSQNKDLIQRVKEVINHGLTLEREVPRCGINGKMSEYHAAIGHAELDNWARKRSKWLELKVRYDEAFGSLARTTPLSSFAWVGSTFCVRVIGHSGGAIRSYLENSGVASRQVWGGGIHKYETYAQENALPITDLLAEEVIFLPYSIDQTDAEIESIVTAVQKAIIACA